MVNFIYEVFIFILISVSVLSIIFLSFGEEQYGLRRLFALVEVTIKHHR